MCVCYSYTNKHTDTNISTPKTVTLKNHSFTNKLVNRKQIFYTTICIMFIILAVHFTLQNVEATKQPTLRYNILAIVYSEGCQTMMNHNINSSCPTLNKIWKYDTSNHIISGNMTLKNGKFIRSNPAVKNHYLWYTSPKTIVCVDCKLPLDRPDVFKTIFIEPSSFSFINKTFTLKNTNAWATYSNRYVSPDCLSSTIGYSDLLLNDTINYMLSNCTITKISNNQTNYIKNTPFQFNNPFSTLHYEKQISDMKKNGMGNCITIKCNTKDPYSKSNWNKK